MQQRQMIFFLLAGLCSGWVAPLGVRSVPYHIGTLPESTMTHSSNDSSPALPRDPPHPHPIEGTWVLQSIYPGDLKSHRQLADTFTDIFKHHPMTVTVQGNNKTSNEIEFNLRMDVLGARIDGCGSLEVSCATYYTLYIHSIRPVSPRGTSLSAAALFRTLCPSSLEFVASKRQGSASPSRSYPCVEDSL
jgi:hypothetical protein